MPAQCTRPNGRRMADPNCTIVPGACWRRGRPWSSARGSSRARRSRSGAAPSRRTSRRTPRAPPCAAAPWSGRRTPATWSRRRTRAGRRAARLRGVVEDGPGRAGVVDAEPVEPGLAPERRPVDRVALHQLPHVHVAQQLEPAGRQLGEPVDVEHQWAAGRHDHPPAATTPRPVWTTARWSCCSIRCTGAPSATMSPSLLASRSGISWEPPTKRRSWAPLAVSELRAKVPTCRSSPEQAT